MYGLTLFIIAVVCIPLGYYLIALANKLEANKLAQKKPVKKNELVKYDNRKDWVDNDQHEDDFVDYEIVD